MKTKKGDLEMAENIGSHTVIGVVRDRGRKKRLGHGKFGGDGAWKHRHYDDDGWSRSARAAKETRSRIQAYPGQPATTASKVFGASICEQDLLQIGEATMASASYGGGILTAVFDCNAPNKVVIAGHGDWARVKASSVKPTVEIATDVKKAKRRRGHRGGRRHRRQQQLATAA